MSLRTCPACDGFVPDAADRCPHCTRGARGGVLRVLAGTFALTLMACYGVPPGMMRQPEGPAGCVDADGDGVCPPLDCNDHDKTIYPGAADPDGDGIDQNCDGIDGWRDPAQVATPPATQPTPTPAPTSQPTTP